jgi:hypothetical protein
MYGVLPEPEPKEEVRYERVKQAEAREYLSHLKQCHPEVIRVVKEDGRGNIKTIVTDGFHGKTIYMVEI